MSYLGCMLAHEINPKKVKYPVAVEDKLDGLRITFINGQGHTRNGNVFESCAPFAKALLEAVGEGVAVDTEMMASNWNETSKLLKRKNDIDHKAIKREVTCWIFDVFSEKVLGTARIAQKP